MSERRNKWLHGLLGGLIGLALWCSEAAAAVDPTRPADYQTGTATEAPRVGGGELRLEAIRALGDKRSAVINGHSVGPGDRIGAARVLRIDADSVTLSRDGRTQRLKLGRTLTKHWNKQD